MTSKSIALFKNVLNSLLVSGIKRAFYLLSFKFVTFCIMREFMCDALIRHSFYGFASPRALAKCYYRSVEYFINHNTIPRMRLVGKLTPIVSNSAGEKICL